MTLLFASNSSDTIPLHVLSEAELPAWLDAQPDQTRAWVHAHDFKAAAGSALAIPGAAGVSAALIGYGSPSGRKRGRYFLAAGLARLPAADYAIASWPEVASAENECYGALLGLYAFDRYRTQKPAKARLVAPKQIDAARIETLAAGEALARDLINTPASDMGPPDLEAAARDLAAKFGAEISVTTGDDLLDANFPMIHTVGRAADRAPRLIDFRWGNAGPTVTLVGKGVCFDTGGLNLKPGASMGLMKKDMGGSANVLGLAAMLMGTQTPIPVSYTHLTLPTIYSV